MNIIDKLQPNPKNPRIISDEDFARLKAKIKEFPEMLEKRPIVYDEKFIVLAGNQRLRVLKELVKEGFILKDTYFSDASGWTEDKKRQFVITDNISDGSWDYELLANEWDDLPHRERLIFLCSREDFEEKRPQTTNESVRFRDIRDNSGSYKFINYEGRHKEKIEQKRKFNYELIGGYDRVGTLTTQYGCGEKAVYEDGKFRYLTPLECERLQGFDDGYTEGVSDNARYWALGNAVNVNMSKYLFKDYLKGVWW